MHLSPSSFTDAPKILAYLDPGSGSIIIQMIIAAILGGGLIIRSAWNRVIGKREDTSKKTEEKHSGDGENINE